MTDAVTGPVTAARRGHPSPARVGGSAGCQGSDRGSAQLSLNVTSPASPADSVTVSVPAPRPEGGSLGGEVSTAPAAMSLRVSQAESQVKFPGPGRRWHGHGVCELLSVTVTVRVTVAASPPHFNMQRPH